MHLMNKYNTYIMLFYTKRLLEGTAHMLGWYYSRNICKSTASQVEDLQMFWFPELRWADDRELEDS